MNGGADVYLPKPCHLCGTTLRPVVNRQTKVKSAPNVWACEHCDQPHELSGRCPQCVQVVKAMRP